MRESTASIALHVLALPGDRIDGVRVVDVCVHALRDAAFVAGRSASGPVVLIGSASLADVIAPGDSPVDVYRTVTGWTVAPSSTSDPISPWPAHIDLHRWVERAFGSEPDRAENPRDQRESARFGPRRKRW